MFGGSGRTGRHFVALALKEGHTVRALVRKPEALRIDHANLDLRQGSISDTASLDGLLGGIDHVVVMLGDAPRQQHDNINEAFVAQLVPAMRRTGVRRMLYQAGGFTRPYAQALPPMTWILKNTVARFAGLLGQHRDNEAVLTYLVEQAPDIEWIVHRASIISDAPSKGSLQRSATRFSLATFADCADYNFRTVLDGSAIHSCDLSHYERQAPLR